MENRPPSQTTSSDSSGRHLCRADLRYTGYDRKSLGLHPCHPSCHDHRNRSLYPCRAGWAEIYDTRVTTAKPSVCTRATPRAKTAATAVCTLAVQVGRDLRYTGYDRKTLGLHPCHPSCQARRNRPPRATPRGDRLAAALVFAQQLVGQNANHDDRAHHREVERRLDMQHVDQVPEHLNQRSAK